MSDHVEDRKYIVFKRDEWERWGRGNSVTEGGFPPPAPLEDAVVIRTQDIFAPPALDAYANSIQVSLELLPLGEQWEDLKSIADYFHTRAAEAWLQARKVPD